MWFFFNDTATTEIYTLSLHDALPICAGQPPRGRRERQGQRRPHLRGADRPADRHRGRRLGARWRWRRLLRSEEHTSELQSRQYLVCRLLLEKKESHSIRTAHDRTEVK